MPKKIEDMIGKKFGKLTVIREIEGYKFRRRYYECLCECGNTTIVEQSKLRTGHTQSCGCLHKERLIARNTTHGGSKDRLYKVWRDMLDRCYNPNEKSYVFYGYRGITVCDEWRKDYKSFKKFMVDLGYDDTLPTGEQTIDRIDVNGNYCPDNCRLLTNKEQQNNKRSNKWITYKGETNNIRQWSHKLNIPEGIIQYRLNKGWDVDDIFNKPIRKPSRFKLKGKYYSIKEISEMFGKDEETIRYHLIEKKRSLEELYKYYKGIIKF